MPIDFEERPLGIYPVFGGTYKMESVNIGPWEPAPGNKVILHVDHVAVNARITSADNREYCGVVIGFEGHDEYEYNGLKPEDAIAFSYAHIFSCSRD